MQVGEIMRTGVKTAAPDASFADVAEILQAERISSVVIVDSDGIAGIVTERDLVNLVADRIDPGVTPVSERMTRDVDTVDPRTDVAEAAERMARLHIRHIPVVDRDELVGIISIRDLTTWAVEELSGGRELADLHGSQATLSAAARVNRTTT